MLAVKHVIAILASVIALASCSRPVVSEFYVVIVPDDTGRLLQTLATIAREDGLTTATGKAVARDGNTMRVIEAQGRGLTLWVQNLPLSGNEDPSLCGTHQGPYPDPAQYVVFTTAGFIGSKSDAMDLAARVFSKMRAAGFDARKQTIVCGEAVARGKS